MQGAALSALGRQLRRRHALSRSRWRIRQAGNHALRLVALSVRQCGGTRAHPGDDAAQRAYRDPGPESQCQPWVTVVAILRRVRTASASSRAVMRMAIRGTLPTARPSSSAARKCVPPGRVSMDMMTIDFTDVPEAAVGSPVILWGEGLSVDDVAAAASTVGYELLCAVAPRVPCVSYAHRQSRHRAVSPGNREAPACTPSSPAPPGSSVRIS